MSMPKLSVSLPLPARPDRCQKCGAAGSLEPPIDARGKATDMASLEAWREHDADDKPGRAIVILCRKCGVKVIEPHPRLYSAIPAWSPTPGIMAICDGCQFRRGILCEHPLSLINGGKGIDIAGPSPTVTHLRIEKRYGGSRWEKFHVGPPESCSGREEILGVPAS